jgi:hypothetical protein
MKRFLSVLCCAGLIGLFSAGCGGGTEAPPTGAAADPSVRVKELLKIMKEAKRPEAKANAARALGQFGPAAAEALPELEKLTKDRSKNASGAAKEAITKIKGG